MLKGKLRIREKCISVAFIPHSTNKVKVLKFSALYSKLPLILIAICLAIITLALFVAYTVNMNSKLLVEQKKLITSISDLNDLNISKANEIAKLREIQENTEKITKEFSDKYKEITDIYLNNRSDSRVNRSGDRNERSFVSDINQLKGILDNLDKLNVSGSDLFVSLSDTEEKLKEYTECLPTKWPIEGRISDEFGYRKDPITRMTKFHGGIDIAATFSQDVHAPGNATVAFAGWYSDYGNMVILDHGHGISTMYAHNYRLLVKQGQEVQKGDVIAKAGSSGRSTGTHLHFEVRLNGSPVDPAKYLDSK